MTSNQVFQQLILTASPIVISIAYIAYQEKKFKLVAPAILTFAIQYFLIFITFYVLIQQQIYSLNVDVSLAYLLSGIVGMTALIMKPRLIEFTAICIFSTLASVIFLPKELMILVATGIGSALLAALLVKGILPRASSGH